jgi:hypothetical protein
VALTSGDQVLQVWYQRGALPEHSEAVGKALQHVKSLGPVRTEAEERAETQRQEVRSRAARHHAAQPRSCRVTRQLPRMVLQEKRRAENRRREEEDARREAERAAAPGSSDSSGTAGTDSSRKRRPERRDTEMEGRKGAAAAMSGLGQVGQDEGELLAQIEKERSANKETRMEASLRPADV